MKIKRIMTTAGRAATPAAKTARELTERNVNRLPRVVSVQNDVTRRIDEPGRRSRALVRSL